MAIVGCGNLYISARFCRQAYNHPMKVLVHGVARTHGRGFPGFAIQAEQINIKEQQKVRGTVIAAKLAKLTGDKACPDLVAVSVYDTKPVHFLSMACKEIKWIEKTRLVFDKALDKMVPLKFLRLNVNDDYNNGMGSVDIADQLRLFYRFHHWMRKSKWWHSIFWWGFSVQLVNAYKCYTTHHKLLGSKPLSHYEFQKSVGDCWVSNYASDESVSTARASTSTSSLTVSSLGTEATRRPRFCDASLDPMTGVCRKRLDHSLYWD